MCIKINLCKLNHERNAGLIDCSKLFFGIHLDQSFKYSCQRRAIEVAEFHFLLRFPGTFIYSLLFFAVHAFLSPCCGSIRSDTKFCKSLQDKRNSCFSVISFNYY